MSDYQKLSRPGGLPPTEATKAYRDVWSTMPDFQREALVTLRLNHAETIPKIIRTQADFEAAVEDIERAIARALWETGG